MIFKLIQSRSTIQNQMPGCSKFTRVGRTWAVGKGGLAIFHLLVQHMHTQKWTLWCNIFGALTSFSSIVQSFLLHHISCVLLFLSTCYFLLMCCWNFKISTKMKLKFKQVEVIVKEHPAVPQDLL